MPPPREPKDFKRGLLAHFILVLPWIVPPLLLAACGFCSGFGHGVLAALTGMALSVSLVLTDTMAQRLPLCLVLFGLGATAPSQDGKVVALFGAGLASLMAWLSKGGKGPWNVRPGLRDWLVQWAPHYYDQCELHGELNKIHKDKTFFAFHPHGMLAAGWTMNGTYNPKFHKTGKINWLCDYNLRYKNPAFRWLCDTTKFDESEVEAADKKTFKSVMEKGENCAILPGGFQDAVAYQYNKDVVVMKRRKGFIKYCLQYGYRVHPVYTFGESSTYHAFTGLRKLRMVISERNIPMVVFFGWPFLPFLPRPEAKLLTYIGPPIDMPHIDVPTKEEIEKWHSMYIEALVSLFDAKKSEAGYPDSTLEIA